MGQEQAQLNSNKLLESDIDVITDIYENQPHNKIERTLQAIRISESQRSPDQLDPNLQKIQITDDFCNLDRGKQQKQELKQQVILQGILKKQGPKILFSQSSDRYCYLSEGKFTYCQNSDPKSKPSGILNFNLLSCSILFSSKNNSVQLFRIKVSACQKQFIFSSPHIQQNKKWVDALIKVTSQSIGQKFNLTYLSHYHRFWRKDYFSQNQFRNAAQTGDIILMRGFNQSALVQRVITQQQYDHVALVLKNIKGQVLLFEANGAVGVGIMPWHRFISKQFFKQQQIVVYRKLKINRTKQFFEEFEEFVERNMGRKYKFSVKKFLMNRQSFEDKDKKSYFCSSLVGKLYKNLELLDEKLSSTQYMPHSFSEKQNLLLRQNGKYGPANLQKQQIIVFQKMFFQKSN